MKNIESSIEEKWDLNLDYSGQNNFSSFFISNGNIHSYPAKAVPNMVNSILLRLKENYNISKVLDPFVGSGTVGLESKYLGLDFYGSDLNPLAVLISRTKTLTIHRTEEFTKKIQSFVKQLQTTYENTNAVNLANFKNIEYWFKEENIRELSFLKQQIINFVKNLPKEQLEPCSLILFTAFSSSIRMCSLTRNSEFKLYKMSPHDVAKFNVNAINIFIKNIGQLLEMLQKVSKVYKKKTISNIQLDNAKQLSFMKNKKVDLILTSPPYGDSRSTVAYGQFSRLSIQWMSDMLNKFLNIDIKSENCDELLLGGNKSDAELSNDVVLSRSKTLKALADEMDKVVIDESNRLCLLRSEIITLREYIINEGLLVKETISEDLLKLISERIRLDYYRQENQSESSSNKDVKEISRRNVELFFEELFRFDTVDLSYKKVLIAEFLLKLPKVLETINRKIKSIPKRKVEVLSFFTDLYKVVLRTDEVLKKDGVQAWIVGHRTVLGKVNVNMKEILNDWFISLGYIQLSYIKRQYSFKRLPNHIKSTVSRSDEIQTMMQEHILIVQKDIKP